MITDRNLLPEDYYDSYMQTCLERDIRDLIAVSLYRRKSQSGGEPDRYDERYRHWPENGRRMDVHSGFLMTCISACAVFRKYHQTHCKTTETVFHGYRTRLLSHAAESFGNAGIVCYGRRNV